MLERRGMKWAGLAAGGLAVTSAAALLVVALTGRTLAQDLTALDKMLGPVLCTHSSGRTFRSGAEGERLTLDDDGNLVYRYQMRMNGRIDPPGDRPWRDVAARLPVASVAPQDPVHRLEAGTCRVVELACIGADCVTVEVGAPGIPFTFYGERIDFYLDDEEASKKFEAGLSAYLKNGPASD